MTHVPLFLCRLIAAAPALHLIHNNQSISFTTTSSLVFQSVSKAGVPAGNDDDDWFQSNVGKNLTSG